MRQSIPPDNHATSPGLALTAVSISAWQVGQIMWVDFTPTGTIVVTIVVPGEPFIGQENMFHSIVT